MNFEQYITNDFHPLSLQDTVNVAIELFKALPFTHFPIIENGKLIAMIGQSDISNLPKENRMLKEVTQFFQFYKSDSDTNCIDLLTLFAAYDTDIIPVTDLNNVYLGYFELDDIIKLFYKTPFLDNNATTLIVEKKSLHVSMSEITQIIESNGINLLGMYLSDIYDEKTQITLRIETENVNEVIQSFRRFGYEVLSKNEDDLLIEQLKERSLYLQKFYDL